MFLKIACKIELGELFSCKHDFDLFGTIKNVVSNLIINMATHVQ
jgi:NADH:ubiquinone oxidoreductase subunit B-like Fe-S oxidoreductase